MSEKIKVIIDSRKNKCYVIFKGISYEIDCKTLPDILDKIKSYKNNYRRLQRSAIEYAASLGVVFAIVDASGEYSIRSMQEKEIENLLKKNCKSMYVSL